MNPPEENPINVLLELKRLNLRRCEEGFGTKVKDWLPSQWSNAIAGETGELCNLVKKYERGDFGKEIFRKELAKEAADIVIYLDLLCQRESIDLSTAIVEKFNEVSDRVGSDIKIKH